MFDDNLLLSLAFTSPVSTCFYGAEAHMAFHADLVTLLLTWRVIGASTSTPSPRGAAWTLPDVTQGPDEAAPVAEA